MLQCCPGCNKLRVCFAAGMSRLLLLVVPPLLLTCIGRDGNSCVGRQGWHHACDIPVQHAGRQVVVTQSVQTVVTGVCAADPGVVMTCMHCC